MDFLFSIINILELLVIAAIPLSFIIWFVLSLVSVIKKRKNKEPISEFLILSLVFSALFFIGIVASIAYIVYIFSNGISFM